MIKKDKNFFVEVIDELKKVSWSTRGEILSATWIIIVTSAFFGIFIGLSDFVFSQAIQVILK